MLAASRDIIMIAVGMGEQPEARRALEPLGEHSPLHGFDSYRVAFWVPLPPNRLPKLAKRKRDDSRSSVVPDATDSELRAIRDGVIEEIVLEWQCEKVAPEEWRIRAMKQAWARLAKDRAGVSREASVPVLVSPQIEARDFANRRLVVGSG